MFLSLSSVRLPAVILFKRNKYQIISNLPTNPESWGENALAVRSWLWKDECFLSLSHSRATVVDTFASLALESPALIKFISRIQYSFLPMLNVRWISLNLLWSFYRTRKFLCLSEDITISRVHFSDCDSRSPHTERPLWTRSQTVILKSLKQSAFKHIWQG